MYRSIPILLPQDATLDEILQIRRQEYANRRTITQSHDEVIALVTMGDIGSYVIIYGLERWPVENQAQLLAIPNELRDFAPNKLTLPNLYNQRDARWANKLIGQLTGHTRTIGNWGCLLVSYNMMAQFLELTTLRPDTYNDYLVTKGAFYGPYIRPGALQTAHPNEVNYVGYMERGDELNQQIRNWIDRNLPVPIRVDFNPVTSQWEQHWVLVVGYTDTDFIIADPWHGDEILLSERYNISGSDVLEGIFYELRTTPPPTNTINLLDYMIADPYAWRVVRHPSGAQEDFQDYNYGDGRWAMQKNNADHAEFWRHDNTHIYLYEDTSPAPAHDGTDRLYRVNPGQWARRQMAIGETFNDGGHVVQFYAKATCQPHPENSGNATNVTTVLDLLHNYTFNAYGQNITLDEVLFLQSGSETQVFARHNNKALGRVAWISPWGRSEIVELYWNRGRLNNPPRQYCA